MARTKGYTKYTEDHPTVKAIRKYEEEIKDLQEKYNQATEAHDWSMRNWYANMIAAKRANMELLKEKFGMKRAVKVHPTDD